jgi:hypothetical protein
MQYMLLSALNVLAFLCFREKSVTGNAPESAGKRPLKTQ